MNTYVKSPIQPKCTNVQNSTLSTSSFFSASLQGETGRPGMPGEKGDIGAVVRDYRHHRPPTQTTPNKTFITSL